MSVRLGKLEDSYLLECVAASWGGGGFLHFMGTMGGTALPPKKAASYLTHQNAQLHCCGDF